MTTEPPEKALSSTSDDRANQNMSMCSSFWDEKERARRADVEALRSGGKTEEQLKRENEVFALPADRIRLNLDSAHSLS